MNNPYKLSLSKYSTHNIIIKNIGKNNYVLDVGCNDGYIGKHTDESNVFYGMDYLEDSVQKAKEGYRDAILYDLNNLENLPWDLKFDVIVLADVLEHLSNPEKVLNFFVANYLKENGRVIISLPNIANWQIRLYLLLGKFDYLETGIMDKTHLHFYTFKSARKLIEKTNLNIIRSFGGASFFGFVIKILPFLKKILATNIILIAKK